MESVIYDEDEIVTKIQVTDHKALWIEQHAPWSNQTQRIVLSKDEAHRMLSDVKKMLEKGDE